MSSSKIQLKVQHQKHSKQQKSGAKLGKSKNKQKQPQKLIVQQAQQQEPKLNKSKSKQKDKLKDKKQQKKTKQKKQDKKNKKKKDKNQEQVQNEGPNSKKNKKDKNKKQQQKQKQDQSKIKNKNVISSKIQKDKQLQTINSINKQSNRAKLTIGQLINLYKDVSYDIFVNHGHNPIKQKQIQNQLLRLQQQKQLRKQKLQSLRKSQEQRFIQKQKKMQQKRKIRQQKIKQNKKLIISQRLNSLSQVAKKRQEDNQNFKKYASERKRNFIPRYKKYQQKFKQFQQILKEQEQQIIQQRKIKALPLDYQQLQRFEQHYIQQKGEAIEHSQNKSRLQKKILNQQNQWMKKLYRGSTFKKVKEQKLNSYQNYMTIAKQKLQRTKQYGKQIKQKNFQITKTDQDDNQRKIIQNNQNVVYREKYVMGKSLGLVPQKKVKPLTNKQKQKLGVQYLQYIRNLPRKVNSTQISNTINPTSSSRISQKIGKTYILKRSKNPYYNIQRNGTSFDARNPQEINLAIVQIRQKDQITALQEKQLHYLQYKDVLDLQKRHLSVNKRLVGDISSKLEMLKRLVD